MMLRWWWWRWWLLGGKGNRLVVFPSSGTVPDSAEGCSKRLGRGSRDWRARSIGQAVCLMGIRRLWLLVMLVLMGVLLMVIVMRVRAARMMRRMKTGR